MELLQVEYVLLAFLGMILHILMKVMEQMKKSKSKFSFKTFFTDSMNWVRIIMSIISIMALILMADDLSEIIGIQLKDGSPARSIFAFGAGYLNHSMIRNVLKMFKKAQTNAADNA